MDITAKSVEQNMTLDTKRLQGSKVLCCSEMNSDTEDATSACCACQTVEPNKGKVSMQKLASIFFIVGESCIHGRQLETVIDYYCHFPLMTLLNKMLWSKRQVSDQRPEFNEHKFKDPLVESTFSCTVAIPCKPWSHRMEKCCNLGLLKLQRGADEA